MGQGEKPTPTPQQWEVIRETDRHILVAAGAGTGKTFTVVSKVLYLLGEEVCGKRCAAPLALRDIAAITFTNKAAAELKEKLRDALKKAGRRAESREVDGARVGTIHSFCGDILRELALRGGHAPSPRLLDDAEGALLRAEVVRETLLEAVTADAASPEAIPALNDLLSTWSVKEVERWMAELLDQGDQLRALAARAEAHGALEGALVRLASRAAARLGERLRDAGQMDFDRMITWTRDLIRSEPAVRRALQQRIRVLVIDEFQDVDPVQKEIAYLLGEPESGRADTTRLVLVGDPKQSIYRFRRADVKVWRAVERDFTERGWGAVLPLAENRRSVPGVLGFVDHAIGKLLDTPLGGDGQMRDFEVPYASVAPVRPDNDGVPAVEMLVVPPDENGKCRTADPVRRSEAAAVARRARELNEQGVPWKEMAVLLSGWGALDIYRGALEREGIPTYALRASGFYERPEITDIVVALQAIRDPHDDRVLVGFLRGPFVCVSDETLLRIARQTPVPCWPALGSVVLDDPEEAARLARGRRLLERLSAARDRIPVAELLHELLEESGYLAHLALLGASGKQKIANVRKLLRMLAARPEASASDVILAIERARELELLEGEARLYGEKDDVLTITSIHSAKGLEWGTVFWCDLVRAGTDGRSKLAVAGEELRLAVPEVETDEQPDDWKRIRGLAKEEREAEAKRLWYVAATRAKDRLVLSGIPLGSGGR
ncbi:MAG TPA: UvrD-helicase domain-containing protein, partial [Gemmatimonadaceae bacterium]|nr:UvrD-helicase domain-containing protein [Gemmatimonadaceae bacterium]